MQFHRPVIPGDRLGRTPTVRKARQVHNQGQPGGKL